MKQTLLLFSGAILAMLMSSGCSDQSGATAKVATSEEDTAAIEQVFNELKREPESLSVYPPDERPLIAYFQVMMARFVSAFQTDEARKKEVEKAFADLINKHGLADTLEFTDNEDRMKAAAATSFANVDLDVFIVDVRAYMNTYGSVSSDGDTHFEDEEEATPVSMQGLKLNGDEAKATIIHSDETEQPFVFVKSAGQWFVSWDRTYGEPEDGSSGITTEESLVVTFENEAALENATAKKLLEGVDYDRSSRPTLVRTKSPLQAELTFYVGIGGDGTTNSMEAAFARGEARMNAIKNSPGVQDVAHSFGREFDEQMEEAFATIPDEAFKIGAIEITNFDGRPPTANASSGPATVNLTGLASRSAQNPSDTLLALQVAALQVWFDRDANYQETRKRMLTWAASTTDPAVAERVAKIASLRQSPSILVQHDTLKLARRAVELGQENPSLPWFHLSLGMAELRIGNYAAADRSLRSALREARALDASRRARVAGVASFYLVMNLVHQGEGNEARDLFRQTAATITPPPADKQSPLVGQTAHDDLIVWLAYEEAKMMLEGPSK